MRILKPENNQNLANVVVECTPIEDLGDGKFKCLVQMKVGDEELSKGVEITLDLSGQHQKTPPA